MAVVCGAHQPASGFLGFFLLPTLSFFPGNQSFTCRVTSRTVVLDLSGSTVTEDANTDMPYEFADGTKLLFLPRTLEPPRSRSRSTASPLTFWRDSVNALRRNTNEVPLRITVSSAPWPALARAPATRSRRW